MAARLHSCNRYARETAPTFPIAPGAGGFGSTCYDDVGVVDAVVVAVVVAAVEDIYSGSIDRFTADDSNCPVVDSGFDDESTSLLVIVLFSCWLSDDYVCYYLCLRCERKGNGYLSRGWVSVKGMYVCHGDVCLSGGCVCKCHGCLSCLLKKIRHARSLPLRGCEGMLSISHDVCMYDMVRLNGMWFWERLVLRGSVEEDSISR